MHFENEIDLELINYRIANIVNDYELYRIYDQENVDRVSQRTIDLMSEYEIDPGIFLIGQKGVILFAIAEYSLLLESDECEVNNFPHNRSREITAIETLVKQLCIYNGENLSQRVNNNPNENFEFIPTHPDNTRYTSDQEKIIRARRHNLPDQANALQQSYYDGLWFPRELIMLGIDKPRPVTYLVTTEDTNASRITHGGEAIIIIPEKHIKNASVNQHEAVHHHSMHTLVANWSNLGMGFMEAITDDLVDVPSGYPVCRMVTYMLDRALKGDPSFRDMRNSLILPNKQNNTEVSRKIIAKFGLKGFLDLMRMSAGYEVTTTLESALLTPAQVASRLIKRDLTIGEQATATDIIIQTAQLEEVDPSDIIHNPDLIWEINGVEGLATELGLDYLYGKPISEIVENRLIADDRLESIFIHNLFRLSWAKLKAYEAYKHTIEEINKAVEVDPIKIQFSQESVAIWRLVCLTAIGKENYPGINLEYTDPNIPLARFYYDIMMNLI